MGIVRQTASVKLLLNEFEETSNAISVIELIKRLDSKINKTTIYRVLDKLKDDGTLHSFLDKTGITWYAKCNGCSKTKHIDTHPHFQCTDCGKIECLSVELNIPKIPNREVTASQILIEGKCEACYE
ncbi:Fur family transcriptional regulator [Algibacter sp. PT7-4]|uniref:Fur family transcriptional regulator n=1 Tax=Algibacter ulvanivorans TaxID=3400999 RepID=UPI003AAC7FFD